MHMDRARFTLLPKNCPARSDAEQYGSSSHSYIFAGSFTLTHFRIWSSFPPEILPAGATCRMRRAIRQLTQLIGSFTRTQGILISVVPGETDLSETFSRISRSPPPGLANKIISKHPSDRPRAGQTFATFAERQGIHTR